MTGRSRLDRVFARLLMNHPYGWALYKKVSARSLQPGAIVYFDSEGDLKILTKPQDDVFSSRESESIVWGPKVSTSVVTRQVGGEIGAPVIAAPVEASLKLSWQNMADEGAVLVTESPVTKEEVNDEISVIDWVKKNAEELLERHRSVIDDHGIWIITKTYKSRRSAVAVMSSRLSSVELGVGASVPSILTLTPSSSWTSGSADVAIELHEDDKGVVTFFSGIYLTKRAVFPGLKRISRQDKQKKNLFRHGHPESKTDDRTELTENEDELQLFSCGLE